MKTTGILHKELAGIIAASGAHDKIVVCDACFPVPQGKRIIDLALTYNIPTLIDTVRTIIGESTIERAIIAEELQKNDPALFKKLTDLLGTIPVTVCSYDEFRTRCTGDQTLGFIRTGDAALYANIILVSGIPAAKSS